MPEVAKRTEEILVPAEICEILRIKKAKFYYLASRGRLSLLFKVGNEWRTPRAELEEWIRNNTAVVLSMSERRASMAEQIELEGVSIDEVRALLAEQDYEVTGENDNVLRVRDLESGIVMRTVLEQNILFSTVSCLVAPANSVTPELMRKMLAADNGISTSAFQLYDRNDGTVAITLNNFCKLQAMGSDDRDDILSCLDFLVVDVYAARDLLGDLVN